MLKTGIYTLDQIERYQPKSFIGDPKRISITLYNKILNLPNAEELAEKLLLLFTDERGAYKRTYHNRFNDFDGQVIKIIQEDFTASQNLRIHDVGISDGRTSLDFFQQIKKYYSDFIYDASDYDPRVYVIQKGKTKVTLSQNHKIIEILWPPFVFNATNPDVLKYYPLNRLVQYFVTRLVVKPIMQEYFAGLLKKEEIYLFCPKVLMQSERDSRFRLQQYNVLTPFEHKNHLIRAMNLLNPSYFNKQEMETVLLNVHNSLEPNGLFITGSNQNSGSPVHGAVYRRSETGFTKIWQSGRGPAIDAKILRFVTHS